MRADLNQGRREKEKADNIKDNNDAHESFSNELRETLLIEADTVKCAIDNLALLSDAEFFDAFALGFSKWLLKLCLGISPAWSIRMTSSCKYRTGNDDQGKPDMLSLAYRFEYIRQPATDAYSLAGNSEQRISTTLTELDFALTMVTEVGSIFNLDIEIEKDDQLKNLLIQHSAELLSSARYDESEYRKWVDAGCPSSN